MEIKQGKPLQMLPPKPGVCRVCATKHEEELPHNRDSLYYQFWFNATYGRSATWVDAMVHCTDEMKRQWIDQLKAHGVPVEKIGGVD